MSWSDSRLCRDELPEDRCLGCRVWGGGSDMLGVGCRV